MLNREDFKVVVAKGIYDLGSNVQESTKDALQLNFMLDRIHHAYITAPKHEQENGVKDLLAITDNTLEQLKATKNNLEAELKRLADGEKHD
ncbi:hypothetical protein [Pseudoalteromonas phage KB12-38]|nr:hypothetical protein [Pseudoalteromonas phage KB12-38]